MLPFCNGIQNGIVDGRFLGQIHETHEAKRRLLPRETGRVGHADRMTIPNDVRRVRNHRPSPFGRMLCDPLGLSSRSALSRVYATLARSGHDGHELRFDLLRNGFANRRGPFLEPMHFHELAVDKLERGNVHLLLPFGNELSTSTIRIGSPAKYGHRRNSSTAFSHDENTWDFPALHRRQSHIDIPIRLPSISRNHSVVRLFLRFVRFFGCRHSAATILPGPIKRTEHPFVPSRRNVTSAQYTYAGSHGRSRKGSHRR